ncbi:MAG: ABC transporter substrate-binding protein, partial [Candidatus Hermodarchaeota archaeon]
LTIYNDSDFLFRTVASDVFQGQALAQLAVDKGITAPITINRDDAYGNGVVEEFAKKFKDLTGSDPVDSIVYDPDATSFSSQIGEIKASSADGIVIVAFPTDAIAIFNEAQTQNVDLKWLGTDGIASTSVTNETAIKDYLTGKLYGTTPASGTNPGSGSLWNQFQSDLTASGGTMGIFGDYVYDAVLVVGKALDLAGVYDGPAIRDAIYAAANGLAGATGANKAFNCAGDPIAQSYDYWNATNGAVMTEEARAVNFPAIGTAVTEPCVTATTPGFEFWIILGILGTIGLLVIRKRK